MNQPIRQAPVGGDARYRRQGKRGFSQIILLGIVAVLVLTGVGGFLLFPEKRIPPSENEKTVQQERSYKDVASPVEPILPRAQSVKNKKTAQQEKSSKEVTSPTEPTSPPVRSIKPPSREGVNRYNYGYFDDASHLPSCGDKKEFFTTLPLALDSFIAIDPLGLLSPTAHVFPAPHLYFRMDRKTPLYAPSNATIIGIDLIQATNRPEFADDAAILFGLCSEFKAYFDHVVDLSPKLQKAFDEATADRCDEYTLTYKNGPVNWKKCNKKVNLQVSEGELIGYAGGGGAQVALDLGAYDSRIKPNNYTSPKRNFRAELPYNVCALDYFSGQLARQLKDKLGGVPDTGSINDIVKSPTCGKVIQDIPGTAKGAWFEPNIDTSRSAHEPPHLALVQGHIDQSLQAFSNGDSTKKSNLEMGLYYFEPKNSGSINLDFAEVKPGNIYCYNTKSNYKNGEPKTIIIQLTNSETLKIEGLDSSSCGSGPWQITNYTEFKR